MAPEDTFGEMVPGALAALGIEADETDLLILRAAHQIWWPVIGELLSTDLSEVEPERVLDLSRAPESG